MVIVLLLFEVHSEFIPSSVAKWDMEVLIYIYIYVCVCVCV